MTFARVGKPGYTADKREIRLDGRVAIVTGAGSAIGRCNAIALAQRGALVIVNNANLDGVTDQSRAHAVVAEILETGGNAVLNQDPVRDFKAAQRMAEDVVARWGRIDILVNNAGVLEEQTFCNSDVVGFRDVVETNLMCAFNCTRAVWDAMKRQSYGRIVMTTPSSGPSENFLQASYSAARMALIGLMQTIAIDGQRHGIHVNCLFPSEAPESVVRSSSGERFEPLFLESVSPAILYLASAGAPTKKILCAGDGAFASTNITVTDGIFLGKSKHAAELLKANEHLLFDREGERVLFPNI